MKKIILILLIAVASTFADDCQRLYNWFVSATYTQQTTICRVSGVEPGRTDILGFFFKIIDNTDLQAKPAVLIYGDYYDTMLYYDQDPMVSTAKCITTGGYRTITAEMTPEQIAAKLLSMKQCNANFTKTHAPTTDNYRYSN